MTIFATMTTGQYFTFPILALLLGALLFAGWLGNPNRKANRRRALQRANTRDPRIDRRGR
jgi:hypothetical protein